MKITDKQALVLAIALTLAVLAIVMTLAAAGSAVGVTGGS